MATIDNILKKRWYTKQELLQCELDWICNWMWAKWWFQFTDKLRKLKYFNWEKERALLFDLDLISDIHDIKFEKWGSIFDYIRANYYFSIDLYTLLNWTSYTARITLFIIVFIWLNLFWFKHFKFK